MTKMASAFVKGWFQGALLAALALVLCGYLGRRWNRAREQRLNAPLPDHTEIVAPQSPAHNPTEVKVKVPKEDENIRQARIFSHCYGSSCYYSISP